MSATVHPLHYHAWSAHRAARGLGIAAATAAIIAAGAYEVSNLLSSGAAPSAMASQSALRLTDRVAPSASLPGYAVTRQPSVVGSARQWAASVEHSSNLAVEAQRLQGLGFVAGVDEQFHGRDSLQTEATSIVERFRSAAAARAELNHQFERSVSGASGASEFAVAGMPGVTAWEFTGHGSHSVNLAFTQGQFYYLIGGSLPPAENQALDQRKIVGAAQLTYLLANGCVATGKTAQAPASTHNTTAATYPVH